MKRKLAVLLLLLLVAVPAFAWQEFTTPNNTIDATGETVAFGFEATEVLVRNFGANEVYIKAFKTGETLAVPDVTDGTGDYRIEPGDWYRLVYPDTDIGSNKGIPGIGLKCSTAETTTVNVQAIRPN